MTKRSLASRAIVLWDLVPGPGRKQTNGGPRGDAKRVLLLCRGRNPLAKSLLKSQETSMTPKLPCSRIAQARMMQQPKTLHNREFELSTNSVSAVSSLPRPLAKRIIHQVQNHCEYLFQCLCNWYPPTGSQPGPSSATAPSSSEPLSLMSQPRYNKQNAIKDPAPSQPNCGETDLPDQKGNLVTNLSN